MKNYKILLVLFIIFLSAGCIDKTNTHKTSIKTDFEWQRKSKTNETFKVQLDSLLDSVKAGKYGYIDEMLISINDTILFDKKFELDYAIISKDKIGKMGCGSNMCLDSNDINIYNYYHPKYHPYFDDSQMHTIQSITKSIASTIVGSAVHDGKLQDVNDPILSYFENYVLSENMKKHLQNTSIKDILTMQLGLEWNEMGMSLEEETNVSAMELSDDWVQYVLNQEIKSEPGTVWNYNSGASQLLAQIVKKATGQDIDEYAKQGLFTKLNITDYYWKKTPTALSDTEGGLYLKSEDLAKIGLLYINDGIWEGERILPVGWVQEAINKQAIDIYGDGGSEGYGYQWWITGDEHPLTVGLGYGNQIVVIIPHLKIVGVIYAWNIFDNKAKYIFRDFVDVLMKLEAK